MTPMTPECDRDNRWVELAKPPVTRYVLTLVAWIPLFGLFAFILSVIFVIRDQEESGNTILTVAGIVVLGFPLLVFPVCRMIHLLLSRPYLRADDEWIEIRHWGGDLRWILPWCVYRTSRVRWSGIRGIREQQSRTGEGIIADHNLLIDVEDGPSIRLRRGVFDKPIEQIAALISNRLTYRDLTATLPLRDAGPFVGRLRVRFRETQCLRYAPKRLRQLGCVASPPTVVGCGVWLWVHLGENRAIEISMAIVFAFTLVWFLVGMDETIRWLRFRHRSFWLRSDGVAAGTDEITASVQPWEAVLGAKRRVRVIVGPIGKEQTFKCDGLDIILRNGDFLWIPEQYSDALDELSGVLAPRDDEVVILAEVVEQD